MCFTYTQLCSSFKWTVCSSSKEPFGSPRGSKLQFAGEQIDSCLIFFKAISIGLKIIDLCKRRKGEQSVVAGLMAQET